jgi:hypothetical protein
MLAKGKHSSLFFRRVREEEKGIFILNLKVNSDTFLAKLNWPDILFPHLMPYLVSML